MPPELDDDEDDDRIPLFTPEEEYDDGPNLGPDARDLDLMDGSWEQRYYSSERRSRDWGAITAGIGLLVLISLLVPALAVVFN